jgi:hypothetical protein
MLPNGRCGGNGPGDAQSERSQRPKVLATRLDLLKHCRAKRREGNRSVAQGALLLPAAAEGLIELNEGLDFVELRPGQRQAVIKIVCLVGEDFKVVGHSSFEAHLG